MLKCKAHPSTEPCTHERRPRSLAANSAGCRGTFERIKKHKQDQWRFTHEANPIASLCVSAEEHGRHASCFFISRLSVMKSILHCCTKQTSSAVAIPMQFSFSRLLLQNTAAPHTGKLMVRKPVKATTNPMANNLDGCFFFCVPFLLGRVHLRTSALSLCSPCFPSSPS